MCTVYTYILYVREYARIYGGISKRIPSLGSPKGDNTWLTSPYYARVESAHITLALEYKLGHLGSNYADLGAEQQWLHLTDFILTHIDRLTSARNCVMLGQPEAWGRRGGALNPLQTLKLMYLWFF